MHYKKAKQQNTDPNDTNHTQSANNTVLPPNHSHNHHQQQNNLNNDPHVITQPIPQFSQLQDMNDIASLQLSLECYPKEEMCTDENYSNYVVDSVFQFPMTPKNANYDDSTYQETGTCIGCDQSNNISSTSPSGVNCMNGTNTTTNVQGNHTNMPSSTTRSTIPIEINGNINGHSIPLTVTDFDDAANLIDNLITLQNLDDLENLHGANIAQNIVCFCSHQPNGEENCNMQPHTHSIDDPNDGSNGYTLGGNDQDNKCCLIIDINSMKPI